jgi:hypothetical protein
MTVPAPTHRRTPVLVTLIYELLDAHEDTARLALTLGPEPEWSAHLDYLRALQRASREIIAAAGEAESNLAVP